MSWKRCLAIGALAMGLGLGSSPAGAEEPTPPAKDETAPADAAKKKEPFFGNRFAMYLETRAGSASIDSIQNPVDTSLQLISDNTISFTGSKAGQLTVGWTLPRDRGQYLLTYNGISDGDYKLDAEGLQQGYTTGTSQNPGNIGFPVPWWHVSVRNGQLTTTQVPPVWNPLADDANGNGTPDPEEIRYPSTTLTVSGSVPKSLGNRIQTWDLYYRREFGGVRIRSRWTAGVRYLDVKGALVTPSWLKGVQDIASFGYSDGVVNHFLLMQQSTTGWGPMGSGEVQFNFFRQRLTLYAMAQAAFLDESISTDSGSFTYFAHDLSTSTFFIPGNGRIQQDVSKTAWNTTIEAGVRVKMLEGFHLILDWNKSGYLDSIIVPTTISIPQNSAQVSLGTTALYVTRDFVVSTINLGLSFQF